MSNYNYDKSIFEELDPAHRDFKFHEGFFAKKIWGDKYKQPNDNTFMGTCSRVAIGIYQNDPNAEARELAQDLMQMGIWMPAGRIWAGAGTEKRVTLNNCYVTGTIQDSMEGIMKELTNFALTMQQGGGDGADFSPIRPENAILRRTGTKASGPLPFMDTWDSMCTTIRSAGDRRGAMMGVMKDTHPDMPKFIVAKRQAGRLTNFNVSVLVSDALMEAIDEDEDWYLHFEVPQFNHPSVIGVEKAEELGYDLSLQQYDFEDNEGTLQYVYSVWKARDLWRMITENTYTYSEPGVIFIDRINENNNLWYAEKISCTNPCGEQPLPPHGACNLGHINLARVVSQPFTKNASINWNLIAQAVKAGVRFLDNVIDVTLFPLPEQQKEQETKRRIGLGFTGLADLFAQMRIRYGSPRSVEIAEEVQKFITEQAYMRSVELAQERGAFPLFDKEKYLQGKFIKKLPQHLREMIAEHGIRNSVILTVAPTGTTSMMFGNVAGGIEPIFSHHQKRKIRQDNGEYKPFTDWAYTASLYKEMFGEDEELPAYMVTMKDLSVYDHIIVQGAIQRWVDSSVSKTVNIPTEMSYDEFVKVYDMAYAHGCKGCTTYRPSEIRGSILADANELATAATVPGTTTDEALIAKGSANSRIRQRPDVLVGKTYKLKWPSRESAIYFTINSDEQSVPFEVFITSKDNSATEWTTALSLMITAIMRKGGDLTFIYEELKQIQAVRDGAWVPKVGYVGSLPALIGYIIERHISPNQSEPAAQVEFTASVEAHKDMANIPEYAMNGKTCPKCHAPSVFKAEGCLKCVNCGHSECG